MIEEVVSSAEDSFKNARKEIRKANDILGKQLPKPVLAPEPDVDKLTVEFRSHFEGKLTKHKVKIAEHDRVSHDDVVKRDLARRKPFDESGRGYRDTLIWHTVLEVEADSIIFGTGNTNDFADAADHSRLDPRLAEELGKRRDCTIAASIPEAVEQLGELRPDLTDAVQEALDAGAPSIVNELLSYVSLPLPSRLEGEIVSAQLTAVRARKVYYSWGVITAHVTGQVEYEYSGTLDEWGVEELDPEFSLDLVDYLADSFTSVVVGEGAADVAFVVAYQAEADSIEVIDAEIQSEGDATSRRKPSRRATI